MVVLCTTDCVPKFECPRDSRAALREVKAVSALKLADEYVVSLLVRFFHPRADARFQRLHVCDSARMFRTTAPRTWHEQCSRSRSHSS